MQAHVPTLFLALITVSLILAVVIAAAGYRRKPELMLWSIAFMMHALAYILFSLRGEIHDFLSIVVANVAISSIFGFVAEGFFLFLKRQAPRFLIWGPAAVTAISFTLLVDDFNARLLLGSFVFGFQALLLAYFVIRDHLQITGRGKYIFAGSAIFEGLTLISRAIFVINGHDFQTLTMPGPLQTFTYLINIVCLILLVFGLLLMTWERDEQIIKEREADLKHASAETEREHKRLETILRTASEGILILDTNGDLIEANDAFFRMHGLNPCAPGELQVSDWNVDHDQAEVKRRIQHILASRDTTVFETRHRKGDAIIDVEVFANAVKVDGQTLIFSAVRDISDRKLQQQELERRVAARTAELSTARAEAESASAVKTRFMANVSHEMRTPLQGILGFAEIGQRRLGKESDEAIGSYFERILESGKRMHKLTESLISLAQDQWQKDSGLADANLQLIDPVALVIQAVSLMETTAATRGQHIAFENMGPILQIQGDEARLRQVLEHLLSNALRFSPDQTSVTVRVQALPAGWTPQISIQVIDQGCGVPEKEMQAIFEPFYESTRTATGAGGTGLGLALCKNILQRHKGSLTVANRPEGGSVFEIVLPGVEPATQSF